MNNTIRNTLTIAALAITISAPVSVAQADSNKSSSMTDTGVHDIYNINNATDHPWEIDGKNIFEINRELRTKRKLSEKAQRDAGEGVVATPKKRNWFQRHFKPATLQQS